MQDGVVDQRRGRGAAGQDRGVGGGRRRGQQVGLRAVERVPLVLRLGRRPLLELGQAATLLLDHLLTWREEEGEGQRARSDPLSVSSRPTYRAERPPHSNQHASLASPQSRRPSTMHPTHTHTSMLPRDTSSRNPPRGPVTQLLTS